MANIQAFRGLRYDLASVGSLSSVVAPPYDVIDSAKQADLYNRSEFNVVRLILNRGDDLIGDETTYDRAAKQLKSWRQDGVLKTENEGVIYVYHQTFEIDGQTYNRRGFMIRLRLEPFGTGCVYPHEETHAKAKEDRFKLNLACRANLSPIFGLFPDAENEVQSVLENAVEDQTPSFAIDDDGVEHRVWIVKAPEAIAAATSLMGPKPIYIADGHHRYESACELQATIRNAENVEVAKGEHPVDYVLMTCVSMQDPGLAILATHRLFRGLDPLSSAELTQKLSGAFGCEIVGTGPEFAEQVWEMIAVEDEQATIGFYCRKDDTWLLARLTTEGESTMERVADDQSEIWRDLGVAILHRLVLRHLLDEQTLPSPKYVRTIDDVVSGLNNGDSAGRDATGQQGTGAPFELAALVLPATVDHVQAMSESGERMPAKSTYFHPKLLSGLVINLLE